jgi:lipoprotein-anchoring transpeptidase ErfK/SrfK
LASDTACRHVAFAASCTSHGSLESGLSKAELASRQRAYTAEAYPVKIVDRRKFDPRFRPAVVTAPAGYAAGTIVVNTRQKLLYLIRSDGKADRYGIAVGTAGYAWKGSAAVGRKATWPAWYPTDEMKQNAPGLPVRIPSGADNPLGARALYLYQKGRDTLYRIHGTSEPWTIGTEASSGCIRMLNEDVIDLYEKAPNGAPVVVL